MTGHLLGVSCPQCKTSIIIEPHLTRSVVRAQATRMVFTRRLGWLMMEAKNEKDLLTRLQRISEMYEYVCQNMALMRQCRPLLAQMEQKLYDYYTLDGWEGAQYFYKRMFEQDLLSTSM